jgi:hypothetical protein
MNSRINNNFSSEIQKLMSKFSETLERFEKEYPDEMNIIFKDHDELFAKYGWYIYDGTSIEDVLIILKLFNEGKSEQAEEKIKKITEYYFTEIETELIKTNAEFSHIIREAIICHKMELYANGELFKKSFFVNLKKQNKNHFLVDIFNKNNLVNKAFITNKSSHSELMRHGIMHGNSINYGNKTNSLKALSLFHFITIRKHKFKK